MKERGKAPVRIAWGAWHETVYPSAGGAVRAEYLRRAGGRRALALAGRRLDWNRALFEVPGTWNRDDFPVRETMQVAHDDGHRFVARTEQDYSDGTRYRFVEDLAEDGALHKVSNGSSAVLMAVVARPDGGRRMVSGRAGSREDTLCYVQAGGDTLACDGRMWRADGTQGRIRCVYHRDPNTVPVGVAPVNDP